jgi:hypothetical protein
VRKRYLISLFLCWLIADVCDAQYVTIPDTAFANWLQNNGFSACMNGNQLDTSCGQVLNADTFAMGAVGIVNLTGIQFFKNLVYLDCSENLITLLPALPPGLTFLSCWENELDSLPLLPTNLKFLNCVANQISRLPALPDSLKIFECGDNPIYNLPALPQNLFALECEGDHLSNLPALPQSLGNLSCGNNVFDSLPQLPPALFSLNCTYDSLFTLPALPPNLHGLTCTSNNLTAIPELPDSLWVFDCSSNIHLSCLPKLKTIVFLNFEHTDIQCLPDTDSISVSNPALGSVPLCGPNGCIVSNIYTPSISNENFKIYPNPATDILYLSFNGNLNHGKICVSDISDKTVYNTTCNGQNTQALDISNLASGIYFLTLQSENERVVRKFVKVGN